MRIGKLLGRGLAGAALTLLAGCATTPRQAQLPPPAEPAAAAAPRPANEPVVQPEHARPADPSPWARLRTRFAMPGCGYSADVPRHASEYTRSPGRFAASWQPAMPFLLLVLAEIEKRDLPGEFALLPYVESRYRPLPAQGNRPAGMWQLMPDTARDRGLRVTRQYDGRLDPFESTRAALELIERYDREFGDWRLATMAFNAGEFRIKRALARAAAPGDGTLAGLGLSPTTYDHLARMLALACIVAEPGRYGVELPEPGDTDHLVIQPVDGPFDLRIAATLAGMPLETMLRYNAAHRELRSAPGAPSRLVLPAPHAARLEAVRSEHPGLLALHWQSRRPTRATDLALLAAGSGVPVAALARANGLDADARVEAGTELLLPGKPSPPGADAVADADALHVVRKGDTLSALARRYGVRLADLLGWNALKANTMLRLGMRLRVRAP